MIENVID